jgi:hypothetical protein
MKFARKFTTKIARPAEPGTGAGWMEKKSPPVNAVIGGGLN